MYCTHQIAVAGSLIEHVFLQSTTPENDHSLTDLLHLQSSSLVTELQLVSTLTSVSSEDSGKRHLVLPQSIGTQSVETRRRRRKQKKNKQKVVCTECAERKNTYIIHFVALRSVQ